MFVFSRILYSDDPFRIEFNRGLAQPFGTLTITGRKGTYTFTVNEMDKVEEYGRIAIQRAYEEPRLEPFGNALLQAAAHTRRLHAV